MSGKVRRWYLNGRTEGLVAIDQGEHGEVQQFEVRIMDGYLSSHHLGSFPSLEKAIAQTGCKLLELSNLGDYPLFYGYDGDEGRFIVMSQAFPGSSILHADKVPQGTYCYSGAIYFFQLWKGFDAVDDQGLLTKAGP